MYTQTHPHILVPECHELSVYYPKIKKKIGPEELQLSLYKNKSDMLVIFNNKYNNTFS